MNSIFELAKSTGETWFEHSKNTYHLGRVLWSLCEKEIAKYFTRNEYCWCCLFHDIGKLLWKGFDDKHTPYTEKAISTFSKIKDYENLLKQFNLPDLSTNTRLISVIKDHHDNKVKGSEFITLADCIASSEYGFISELDTGRYGNYLKFLISDLQELRGYHLVKITFPDSSYLDRVKFGQIFLIKMLRETAWKMCKDEPNSHYLFDIQNGCKILSKYSPVDFGVMIKKYFSNFLTQQFEQNFPISMLVGGKADDFVKVRQYILENKIVLFIDELLKGCHQDILKSLQQQAKIELNPNDMNDMEKLIEHVKNYTGLTQDEMYKVRDYDSSWLGFHLGVTGALPSQCGNIIEESKKKGKLFLKPLSGWLKEKNAEDSDIAINLLLKDIGIQIEGKAYQDVIYQSVARFWNRKNCFLKPDNNVANLQIEPLLDFIAINNRLAPELWSDKNKVCASCGTFRPYLEGGPFIVGFTSRYRETIGKAKEDQPLCPLCYYSMLIYAYLTGIEKGKSLRPRDSAYIVLTGVNILSDIEGFIDETSIFSVEVVKRLKNFKKQFNCQEVIVYTPHETDLDMIVYSIISKNDAYREYPSIQKYSILSEIRDLIQSSENIMGVAIQNEAEIKGPTVIKTQEGETYLARIKDTLDLFNFIRDITYDPKTLIFYFRLWQQDPVLALSRIKKDSSDKNKKAISISEENFKKGVEMMPKDDLFFQLTQQLWQTVALLKQLASGYGSKYEVGKPVKKFKGTPESLDYHMNYLLKDAKCSPESKEQALKLVFELREKLSKLDKREQRELGNYVKKTTHLFSAIAWQEIKKQKGEKGNDSSE